MKTETRGIAGTIDARIALSAIMPLRVPARWHVMATTGDVRLRSSWYTWSGARAGMAQFSGVRGCPARRILRHDHSRTPRLHVAPVRGVPLFRYPGMAAGARPPGGRRSEERR